ncbi:MAG: helix-turn-helix domain-containing protein [Candidatus Nomurabacteria bacterium]|jgi:transcriptional regulator with XRE-family HTH domain|nr:helix-turn-helix domain-containing protein [Candidatus Nomurabacteria bacterium]
MNYSEKLTKILETSGWVQEHLARLMGVSQQALTAWLSGKAEPHEEHAELINKLYKKIVEDIEIIKREHIESVEKSIHRHKIYELDKNNHDLPRQWRKNHAKRVSAPSENDHCC